MFRVDGTLYVTGQIFEQDEGVQGANYVHDDVFAATNVIVGAPKDQALRIGDVLIEGDLHVSRKVFASQINLDKI